MKKLAVLLGMLSLSFNVLAAQSVDESLQANADGWVKIEHVNGQAKVRVWDKSEVKVQGNLSERTKEFIFERDGNEVVIKVKVKNSSGWKSWSSDKGDDLEIYVPKMSQVYYSSVNAEVDIEGVKGSATIDTVNGAISAKNLAGRIRIESVNGQVLADELAGSVKIETVNGDIRSKSRNGKKDQYNSVNGDIDITSASAQVSLETVNGDSQLVLEHVEQLNISSVNGDLVAKMDLAKDGEVDASSVGGDISLYFQEGVSVKFDIEAHAGGSISNDLSNHKMQKAKYGPSRWLEFSLNGGNARVNVSTVNGDIELERRDK